jgi:hypothetical protein
MRAFVSKVHIGNFFLTINWSLRELTVKLMELFGSQLFANIKFRDSFVMIGQRGVPKGKAIELVKCVYDSSNVKNKLAKNYYFFC